MDRMGRALLPMLFTIAASAQTLNMEATAARTSKLSAISKELRWESEAAKRHYTGVAEGLTRQALAQIDEFVADTAPGTRPDELKLALDNLLAEFKNPGSAGSIVIPTILPTGQFLTIGLDLLRLAGAGTDDAISIRAYKETQGKFASVAQIGREMDGRILHALIPLPNSPVPAEFRFISFVGWPAIGTPYSLQARVFAFDGREFRTLWVSREFRTSDLASAIRQIPMGFAIRRLSDDQTRLVDDQYVLTVAGVEHSAQVDAAQ